MFGLGFSELFIIFLIVLILFGAKRIPQLGSGLAEGIRNFTKTFKGSDDEGDKKPEKPEKIEAQTPNSQAAAEETTNTPK